MDEAITFGDMQVYLWRFKFGPHTEQSNIHVVAENSLDAMPFAFAEYVRRCGKKPDDQVEITRQELVSAVVVSGGKA